MSQQFPKLHGQQVVLSRADISTGKVLDEDFQYAIKPQQKIYTIYANAVEGINAAKLIIKTRTDIECYIHDKDEKLISFIDYRNFLDV